MPDREIDHRIYHLRNKIWDERSQFLDALLLHDCVARKDAEAMVWVVGWDLDVFVLAALHDNREEIGD